MVRNRGLLEGRRIVIHILVALRSEARPLLSHFDLEPMPGGVAGRPAFAARDLRLVVTGMGGSKTAFAMEELRGLSRCEPAIAWLNVGIAGHRDLPIGEAILADEVLEAATGRSWKLHPLSEAPCRIGPVCTVDVVEERYPTRAAYEMEAASLCPRAPDALGTGLLQILKVVSDNRQSGTQQISAAFVEELIGRQLQLIEWLVGELRGKVEA